MYLLYTYLPNTSHLPNAGLMLVHRLRRWPNNKTASGERLVFWVWSLAFLVGPDISFGPLMFLNSELLGSNPADLNICHRGCAYTVFQTVQRLGVCSVVYVTLHNEEPLKSFE